MSKASNSKAPCSNCEARPVGAVCVVDEDGLCVLCQKDTGGTAEESFARQRIELQCEVISDLLDAHAALSGHSSQSLLAQNVLDAAIQLVAAHDALSALRCPQRER